MKTPQHSNPSNSRIDVQCDCTAPALLRPSHRTVYCTVQRECGPEGWLQGNKVTDDDDATVYVADNLAKLGVHC